MAPRLEELHPPLDRRVGTARNHRRTTPLAAATPPRRVMTKPGVSPPSPRFPSAGLPRSRTAGSSCSSSSPRRPSPSSRLVVLIAAIGSWWTLIPVMAVDFAVTAAVLITVAKLLEDSDA